MTQYMARHMGPRVLGGRLTSAEGIRLGRAPSGLGRRATRLRLGPSGFHVRIRTRLAVFRNRGFPARSPSLLVDREPCLLAL